MSSSNRSLERGLAILECFRPGVGMLKHREITERCGLPKATVSRLLSSLSARGYLVLDARLHGYRLGVPVLSLARCISMESRLRQEMAPLIHTMAHATQSIIGFGTAHDTDIVYLEACNGDPNRSSRQVGVGMRAPIAKTSVGHGYLAGLSLSERDRWSVDLCAALGQKPAEARRFIDAAAREVKTKGYCMVLYAEGKQAAIGTPVHIENAPLHALGIGYQVPKGHPADKVPSNIARAMEELLDRARTISNTA